MFYTYFHRRLDTGAVFYIGKGSEKRARSRSARSAWWKSVVAKAGFKAEILAAWDTEADAFEHEKFLIACFRDMGAPLVNMTDGGDGASGHSPSGETRRKLSAALIGKPKPPGFGALMSRLGKGRAHSEETREKLRGNTNGAGHVVSDANKQAISKAHLGKVVSAETREKQSAAKRGKALTAAHKARIGAAHMGRSRSVEARQRMSEAALHRHAAA